MKRIKLGVTLAIGCFLSLQVQAATCNNESFNGTFFYTLGGSVKSGTTNVSYDELGKVVADGNGGLTGQTTTSTAGVLATLAVTGTYSVQGNCSGTVTLTTSALSNTFTIQLVSGGALILSSVTTSTVGALGEGRFYRSANSNGSVCGNGTLSGTYGALASGGTYAAGVRTTYEDDSQLVYDGKGGVTVTGIVTTGSSNGVNLNGTGTYAVAADCSGTMQVTGTNGTLNFLLARVQNGTILYLENDPGTTIAGSANPQLFEEVLPQFVFGGGWYSALYFTNTTSSQVSFLVTFTGDAGSPLTVPGVGASKTITVAPNSTTIIEAPNAGATINQGYASFTLPSGVTGYGIFRQSIPGVPDQEAVAGFKSATSTSDSLTWDDTAFTTAVAIVNPSATATTVTITAWDSKGNVIGTSTQALGAGAKIENALRSFAGLSGVEGLRGSALFTVPSGNVSVLGLRFGGSAFTSIPTTQQQ